MDRLASDIFVGRERELADHFFKAAPGGDVDKAIGYAVKAGERATALLAYEEAAAYYQRALQALALKTLDERQRCELLLALGDAQMRSGDTPKARETFRQAADLARRLSAPQQLARVALGLGPGSLEVHAWADELLVGLLEEALSALGNEDSALRATVLARLAKELHFSGVYERRASLSHEAVEIARRLGDRMTLAYVLDCRHWALWRPENVEERLADATEFVRLAQKLGNKAMVLRGHRWRLTDYLELGEMQAVDLESAAYTRLAEELRQPLYLWYRTRIRAMRALLAGRFEEAETLAHQALAMGQRVQERNAAFSFMLQIAVLHRERGRPHEEATEETIKSSIAQYPGVSGWWCALALVYCDQGREAEARKEFAHLAAHDFTDLPHDVGWLFSVCLLSEVCTCLGDARRAATLHALLLPYAQRAIVNGFWANTCHGSASRYLASSPRRCPAGRRRRGTSTTPWQ